MAQDTFYSYKSYRYLILNAILVAVLTAVYLLHRPLGGPNGGTVVGYTYGVIGALGIFYLMWFGIRKRSYYAKHTTLKGCLSAHVWLGISLSVIVPMHSGFSFGMNVHTLAYVLMMVVILSGVWGAINYAELAPEIRSHRGGGTVKKHLEQVRLVSGDIQELAKDKADRFITLMRKVDFDFKPSITGSLFGRSVTTIDKQEISRLLGDLDEKDYEDGLKLINLANKKRELVAQTQKEVATITKLKLWLYIHLPISLALVVVLLIHIFSVFYFW